VSRRDVILLVEDSTTDRSLTMYELRRSGVANELAAADTGLAALDYLYGGDGGAFTTLPLIMLLDLALPQIHGLDVLRRVRSDLRTKHLPVCVLTSCEDDAAVRAAKAQADAVLQKPLVFSRFLATLGRLGLSSRLKVSN
jgi:two-component system response regulator